jgi:ribonuclease T2
MFIRRPLALLAALAMATQALVLSVSPLSAQFGPGPGGRAPFSAQPPPRNEAGRFDYYVLALSWSPTHCATLRREGYDPQCHSRDKQYAFVLHGLWPQHERGWPEHCPIQGRPFVPQRTIDKMLDIMPSRGLVIHQYRKHGTCSGLDPQDYFDVSRKYFQKIKIPPRFELPNQAFTVSPSDVVDDFLSVNPGMKADSIAVSCGGSGNRLREIRICLSREGAYRACGSNENPRRLCSANRMTVPPVRPGGNRQQPRGDGRRI